MICDHLIAPSKPDGIIELSDADVPEMLALTAATEPGPFLPRTNTMGRYFGIRAGDGTLAAMAGQRLRLDGFTEVSAVCTSPAQRGHGHAKALVTHVTSLVLASGATAFLHVLPENASAKAVYAKVGYHLRRPIQLTVVSKRPV